MINLLPPDLKKQIIAGRTNILLVRYSWLLTVLLSIVLAIAALGYLTLETSEANYQRTITDNQQKASKYASVATAAQSFDNNLSVASAIFAKQTNYTRIIMEISAHLPAGSSLETLSLDSANFGKPLDLNIKVKDEVTAIAIKDSFQSSRYFTDVKFNSLSRVDTDARYPVRVVLSITISKDIINESL